MLRFGRVWKMLDAAPEHIRYAWVSEKREDGDIAVAVAIRGVGSCELKIEAARYDGFELAKLLMAGESVWESEETSE